MRDECESCIMKGKCKGVYQESEGCDCCFGKWEGKFSCREACRNKEECYEYTMAGDAVIIKEES